MRELHAMSVRELIQALCQVEDCLRHARVADRVPAAGSLSGDGWDDIGELAAEEQRIVAELRRRRLRTDPSSQTIDDVVAHD